MVANKSGSRRRHERVSVSLPATVTAGTHTIPASTRDISVNGLFVFTEAPLREGSEVEIVLTLPEELGFSASEMICCQGKIVRTELGEGRCGIGATIERFQAFPQA
jgi:PilZ domain